MTIQANLNKTEYQPGEPIILTVTADANERNTDEPITVTTKVADITIESTATKKNPPVPVEVSDDGSREWTQGPDDGVTTTLTATC